MNCIFKTTGIVALGSLGIQTGLAQEAPAKPWNVSATARGFYDDNFATAPSRTANRVSSFGFEVSPSLGYFAELGTTSVNLDYTYGMKYYQARRGNTADHSHAANVRLKNQLTERFSLQFTDSFVLSQEPGLEGAVIGVPLRSDGNNFRNTAGLTLAGKLTELLGIELGYSHNYFDYDQDGVGSRSSILDRTEHLASFNTRWHVLEDTVALVGYQFGLIDQRSKDLLPSVANPSTRDNLSHYVYVGADRTFTELLSGSVRVGGQYTRYPHAIAGVTKSRISPYLDGSATYRFAEKSTIQIGARHSRNQTDVDAGGTLDAETTTIYTSINHRITAPLTGSLNAQYQNSTFNQGTANNKADGLFTAGFSLSYEILRDRLNAEAGYSYDRLDSDLVSRSYYRNRFYLGLKASY